MRLENVGSAKAEVVEKLQQQDEAATKQEEAKSLLNVMSEVICDSKITLEAKPAGRSKATIIARNSVGTLHMDQLNLLDAAKRAGFLKTLDLDEAANKEAVLALIRLAERIESVQEAAEEEPSGTPQPVSFKALEDGPIFEQILHDGKAQFALYDPASQSACLVAKVEDEDGAVYVPVADELLLRGGLQLPSNVEEYGTERNLRDEVEAFVHRHVDVSKFHRKLLALYIIFTWLFDRFSELSYLRLLGEPGNGKSRAGYITSLVCRRPLLLVDPTPSVLFRVVESYGPTLFIDEFNPRHTADDANQLMPILNSGFMRGFLIGRNTKGENGNFETQLFSPFGCKIIAFISHWILPPLNRVGINSGCRRRRAKTSASASPNRCTKKL